MGKGECKPTGALENERELKCGKVGEPQVKPIIPGEEKGVSGVDEETSMPEHNGAEDSLGESMTPVSGGSVTASCDEKEPEHEYDLTEEPLFESVKALLMCWTAANGMDSYDWDHLSIFYAREVSEMPLDDYLDRIFKYSTKSIGCAVAAVIYLRRAAKINPNLCMNAFNAHRLIMMALTAAVKFSEHVVCLNSFYAEVGGLCLEEFNALELEFLLAVDFQLIVSEKEYLECKRMLDGMITPPKVVDVLTNELPLCVVGNHIANFRSINVISGFLSGDDKSRRLCMAVVRTIFGTEEDVYCILRDAHVVLLRSQVYIPQLGLEKKKSLFSRLRTTGTKCK